MSKILLTGSTGFIGSELLKDLSQNNKVYVILRKKSKRDLRNKNIIHIYYNGYKNLNNKIQKLKVTTVIHCATHYVKSHNLKDIEKLTERFFRVDHSRNNLSGGHGLGLTIVNYILAKNEYFLEISSKLGEGSIFKFDLDLS